MSRHKTVLLEKTSQYMLWVELDTASNRFFADCFEMAPGGVRSFLGWYDSLDVERIKKDFKGGCWGCLDR